MAKTIQSNTQMNLSGLKSEAVMPLSRDCTSKWECSLLLTSFMTSVNCGTQKKCKSFPPTFFIYLLFFNKYYVKFHSYPDSNKVEERSFSRVIFVLFFFPPIIISSIFEKSSISVRSSQHGGIAISITILFCLAPPSYLIMVTSSFDMMSLQWWWSERAWDWMDVKQAFLTLKLSAQKWFCCKCVNECQYLSTVINELHTNASRWCFYMFQSLLWIIIITVIALLCNTGLCLVQCASDGLMMLDAMTFCQEKFNDLGCFEHRRVMTPLC